MITFKIYLMLFLAVCITYGMYLKENNYTKL